MKHFLLNKLIGTSFEVDAATLYAAKLAAVAAHPKHFNNDLAFWIVDIDATAAHKAEQQEQAALRAAADAILKEYREEMDEAAAMVKAQQKMDLTRYGLTFSAGTPENLKSALHNAYHSRERVRIVLGDPETGRDWLEIHDVTGVVGRSSGSARAPILVTRKSALGGSAILTANILKIVGTRTKRVFYCAHNYKTPSFKKLRYEDDSGEELYKIVCQDSGDVIAQLGSETRADNLIQFLRCERMIK